MLYRGDQFCWWRKPEKKKRPIASHWQTLSHVVSSAPCKTTILSSSASISCSYSHLPCTPSGLTSYLHLKGWHLFTLNPTRASHWQTLSHVVSSAPRHERDSNSLVVIDTDYTGSCKSNYHTITTTLNQCLSPLKSSNPVHGEVHSIQHVIAFVSDLR
jgi:hypothetical protein